MSYDKIPKEKFYRKMNEKPIIVGFGVFYGDGSSFFGKKVEDWQMTIKENVQLILLYLDKYDEQGNNYRESICSWDYYAFDGKEFTAANDTRLLCSKDILYGWWLDKEEWRRIVTYAMETYTNPWR